MVTIAVLCFHLSLILEPEPLVTPESAQRRGDDAATTDAGGIRGEEPPVSEILQQIVSELEDLEMRARALRERVLALWLAEAAHVPPSPDPAVGPASRGARDEAALEARLAERQRRLLDRWKDLEAIEAASRDGGRRQGLDAALAGERETIRAELRDVLWGLLDLRERRRGGELRRLQAELDALARELQERKEEARRRRLVEERLEDLLRGLAVE